MRRFSAAAAVIALAATPGLVVAGGHTTHAAPATEPAAFSAPAPRIVANAASDIRAMGTDLYSVTIGAWDRTWGDPISGTQLGDVEVRRFLPKSGASTAAFAAAQTLDITTTPQSGHYLGEPSVYTVEGGMLLCRVNPPVTEAGSTWWVETAFFSAATGTWSALKRDEITSIFGTAAACNGAVRRGSEYTVIVGPAQHVLNIGQSIYAVSRSTTGPATISPFTNATGRVPGASTTGWMSVNVNAATGITDLYLGKRVPVSMSVVNYLTVSGASKRISRHSFVMFDLDTHLWTAPKTVFGSAYDASESIVGESSYEPASAIVSSDRQSVTLASVKETTVSVPSWPTITGTSLATSPVNSRITIVGLSARDASRADWRSSVGWTLRYADDSGPHRYDVVISQVRAGAVLVLGRNFVQIDPIQGTARNIRLQFTGNAPGIENAELEWTRAVKTSSYSAVARTWTPRGLGDEVALPGAWTGDGNADSRIASTSVIDGNVVVITDDAGGDSRRTFNSRVLKPSGWSAPQVVARNVMSQEYPWPSVKFLPYGGRTAIVTVQGTAAQANVTSLRAAVSQGVVRRVFSGGQWGTLENLAPLPGADVVGVPSYARVKGSAGMFEVVISNVHPTVPLVGAAYDANEHLDGNAWATLTYFYSGRIPTGAVGSIAVWGWDDAIGWTIGAQNPVIDPAARTVKVPTPIAPQGARPTKSAYIMWYDVTQTILGFP